MTYDDPNQKYVIGKFLYVKRSSEYLPDRWTVYNKGAQMLGTVKWFARWREFTFTPFSGTEYSQECLRDIQQFLVRITNAKRNPAAAAQLTEQKGEGN